MHFRQRLFALTAELFKIELFFLMIPEIVMYLGDFFPSKEHG